MKYFPSFTVMLISEWLLLRLLQVVKRVLSQPVGTDSCDQSWTEMDFFQASEKEYECQ